MHLDRTTNSYLQGHEPGKVTTRFSGKNTLGAGVLERALGTFTCKGCRQSCPKGTLRLRFVWHTSKPNSNIHPKCLGTALKGLKTHLVEGIVSVQQTPLQEVVDSSIARLRKMQLMYDMQSSEYAELEQALKSII